MMSKSSHMPRGLIILMIGFGLFVITLPAVFWYRTDYYDVCPLCAEKRDVQEWLVPFTYTPYYTYYQAQATPLSETLKELNLVDEHDHHWLQGHGNGPGFREIYGEGFLISHGLITSSMGEFVRLIDRFGDDEEMAYWFARITRPEHSYVVRNIADKCVARSYADAEAFHEYLDEVASLEFSQQRFRLGRLTDVPKARTPPRLLYERSSR